MPGQEQLVVGRERELAALRIVLGARTLRDCVLAFDGTPGIGKTTLGERASFKSGSGDPMAAPHHKEAP